MKHLLTILVLITTIPSFAQTLKIVPATNKLEPKHTSSSMKNGNGTINYSATLSQKLHSDVPINSVDLDNDNDLDIYAVSGGSGFGLGDSILLNQGDSLGTFSTNSLNILNHKIGNNHVVVSHLGRNTTYWIDYNKDGYLDLFIKSTDTLNKALFEVFDGDSLGNYTYVTDLVPNYNAQFTTVLTDDIDLDGDIDFVFTATQSISPYDTHTFIMYMDSTELTYTLDTLTPLNGGDDIGYNGSGFIRDLNGDGLKDIVLLPGMFRWIGNGPYSHVEIDSAVTQVYLNDSINGFTAYNHNLPSTYISKLFNGYFDTISGIDCVVYGLNEPLAPGFYTWDTIKYDYITYNINFDNTIVDTTTMTATFDITPINDTMLIGQPLSDFNYHYQIVDVNQDGLSDIVFAQNAILLSLGDGRFSRNVATLGDKKPEMLLFGDYNNDNLIDVSAYIKSVDSTFILIQDSGIINSQPLKVTGVNGTQIDNNFNITWNQGSDNKNGTKSENLTYNVRIGTTPGGSDILAPQSNPQNDFNRVNLNGNVETNSFSIRGLPSGWYYYSVQAVDAGLKTSEWSDENTFHISIIENKEKQLLKTVAYPNPTRDFINLVFDKIGDKNVSVYNLNGQMIYNQNVTDIETNINLSGQPNGMYIVKVEYQNTIGVIKIIKQ